MIVTAEGTTRTYYVAAEMTLWNYLPSWPGNPITGEEFGAGQKAALQGNGRDRIGHRYWKAIYRAYTDATFSTPKLRGSEWRHLGLLGPALRATVGDTVKVVFRNKLKNKSVSLHPHGLHYAKDSEGAAYNDGTAGLDKLDDAVAPGQTHTYTWEVPPHAGPGPADPGSVVWLYHSTVDTEADLNAGLLGPVIISRSFQAREDATPADAQREFVSLFAVFDENASFLAAHNRESLAPEARAEDPDFRRANLMPAVNGYMYGNQPGLEMETGEHVRWHVLGTGMDARPHALHWHGHGLMAYGRHSDTLNVLPGTRASVTMEAGNPGTWLLHCGVGGHAAGGMSALYTVTE